MSAVATASNAMHEADYMLLCYAGAARKLTREGHPQAPQAWDTVLHLISRCRELEPVPSAWVQEMRNRIAVEASSQSCTPV